jgi:hypothetical protein
MVSNHSEIIHIFSFDDVTSCFAAFDDQVKLLLCALPTITLLKS